MKKLLIGAFCASVLFASCSSKEEGTLNGVFSVSETQKVKFSSGNLEYYKSTNTFKFADHQWNVTGHYSGSYKEVEDFTDIFAWGAGDNPTLKLSKKDDKNFTDWGINPIANGGNDKWRTLSAAEWVYLILQRQNAPNLVAYATLENVKGLVILPDDWKQPEGVDFKPLADTLDTRLSQGLTQVKNWSKNKPDLTGANVYTSAQWQKMEDAGALFLPFNNWSNADKAHPEGRYWSTDPDNYVTFSLTTIWPKHGCAVSAFKSAVRLVKDAK